MVTVEQTKGAINMLYESTGEVRAPKTDEYYLNTFCMPDKEKVVALAGGDFVEPWPEVIMRVVNEGQSEVMEIEDIDEMRCLLYRLQLRDVFLRGNWSEADLRQFESRVSGRI